MSDYWNLFFGDYLVCYFDHFPTDEECSANLFDFFERCPDLVSRCWFPRPFLVRESDSFVKEVNYVG